MAVTPTPTTTVETIAKVFVRFESKKGLNAWLKAGGQTIGCYYEKDGTQKAVWLDASLPKGTPVLLVYPGRKPIAAIWNPKRRAVE